MFYSSRGYKHLYELKIFKTSEKFCSLLNKTIYLKITDTSPPPTLALIFWGGRRGRNLVLLCYPLRLTWTQTIIPHLLPEQLRLTCATTPGLSLTSIRMESFPEKGCLMVNTLVCEKRPQQGAGKSDFTSGFWMTLYLFLYNYAPDYTFWVNSKKVYPNLL